MPLSAPTRATRRGYLARKATHHTILSVEFNSADGRTWQAIGGGDTLAAAIAAARDSCPTEATWRPVRWNDLYGH